MKGLSAKLDAIAIFSAIALFCCILMWEASTLCGVLKTNTKTCDSLNGDWQSYVADRLQNRRNVSVSMHFLSNRSPDHIQCFMHYMHIRECLDSDMQIIGCKFNCTIATGSTVDKLTFAKCEDNSIGPATDRLFECQRMSCDACQFSNGRCAASCHRKPPCDSITENSCSAHSMHGPPASSFLSAKGTAASIDCSTRMWCIACATNLQPCNQLVVVLELSLFFILKTSGS